MVEYEFPRQLVTVDVLLFTVAEGRLKVALVPRRSEPDVGAYALPGTYVREEEDEDLEAAAQRLLVAKCGSADGYLEQLCTRSGRSRDPRGWSLTVCYWSLLPREELDRAARDVEMEIVDAHGLEGLPFDHDAIVRSGVERLRGKSTYTTMPVKLLPESFTLRELAGSYEAVLGRPVDNPSFRRWILDLDCVVDGAATPYLVDTGEVRGGANRPAALYRAATPELVSFPQRF